MYVPGAKVIAVTAFFPVVQAGAVCAPQVEHVVDAEDDCGHDEASDA